MTTLNRFPLLSLWAREVARRLGYTAAEAESLGHAYAVLYAIRAAGKPKHKDDQPGAKKDSDLGVWVSDFTPEPICLRDTPR